MMRRKIIALSLFLFGSLAVSAQSFLDHLQKEDQGQGQGSVSVKQSDDISKLVNGKNKQKENTSSQKSDTRSSSSASQSSSPTPRTDNRSAARESSTPSTSSTRQQSSSSTQSSSQSEWEKERARQRSEDKKMREEIRRAAQKKNEDYSSASSTTTSRGAIKKVMRGGRRIDGYMVQVWSGGNTREDKLKAEKVGQEMKSQMPSLPVYVHFYSPRWACRIGNYKKQDDATALVKKLKKMGYRSACVVKASLITRTYK